MGSEPGLPAYGTGRAAPQVRWLGRVPYMKALFLQRRLRAELLAGVAGEALLLMEHPPVVTLGRRARVDDLRVPVAELRRSGVGVYRVERGGRATWHGPGQLVGYPLISLERRRIGSASFVAWLAAWLEERLSELGLEARYRADRPGVWAPGGKVAALGLHTHRGVTMHGFSLNLDPAMDWLDWIDPCGLSDLGVTSVAREQGRAPGVAELARRIEGLGFPVPSKRKK